MGAPDNADSAASCSLTLRQPQFAWQPSSSRAISPTSAAANVNPLRPTVLPDGAERNGKEHRQNAPTQAAAARLLNNVSQLSSDNKEG